MSSPSTPIKASHQSPEEIEGFFGCYLLVSRNERLRIRGRTYIGFTVDPNRRIRQHNAGKKAGGAWRTSKRGPWDMVVMVHGFPNQISALRFEWAWQHPRDSRRLKDLKLKKRAKEKQLDFRIRVLVHMLRSEPWTRLSLTVRWLKEEYKVDFPIELSPPGNVRVACGPVKAAKSIAAKSSCWSFDQDATCQLCRLTVSAADHLTCPQSSCGVSFHILCLARVFLLDDASQLIPIDGRCPKCSSVITWTEAIKKSRMMFKLSKSQQHLLSPNPKNSPCKSDCDLFDL